MKGQFDSLDYINRCPVCEKTGKYSDVAIVKEEENKTVFHLTCSQCQASMLFFISQNKMGAVSLGMLTDLNKSEAVNFVGKEAISADCVIEVHNFLKNLKGGAENLL